METYGRIVPIDAPRGLESILLVFGLSVVNHGPMEPLETILARMGVFMRIRLTTPIFWDRVR